MESPSYNRLEKNRSFLNHLFNILTTQILPGVIVSMQSIIKNLVTSAAPSAKEDEGDELGSQERSGLMPAIKGGPAPLPGYGTGGAPSTGLVVEWHHPLYAKFQVQNTGPQSAGPPPLEL